MSLDVTLKMDIPQERKPSSGIFVRKNGKTVEITEEEWNKENPGREPVRYTPRQEPEETYEVYTDNITHNLTEMASKTCLYYPLWKPEIVGITKAKQLITHLQQGLKDLKETPEEFKKYNPDNGWGNYEGLVTFVEEYLKACEEFPEATIEISR